MSEQKTVREHARSRGALDGTEAQALEGALCQAERDLAASEERAAQWQQRAEEYRADAGVWRDRAEARAAERNEYKSRACQAESRLDEIEQALQCHREVKEALAAAPEATAPVPSCGEYEQGYAAGWQQGHREAPTRQLERDLAAATARVAELERDYRDDMKQALAGIEAANARAVAAERRVTEEHLRFQRSETRLENVVTYAVSCGVEEAPLRAFISDSTNADRAESEAEALRAKIDRAVEHFGIAYGSSPYHWPQAVRDALEILREVKP